MVATGKMSCLDQRLSRTAPMHGSSRSELVPSRPPRVNGWSWPPQAFQVIGWFVYCYLAVATFGIYVPLLPPPWKLVAYALTAVSFIVHLLAHVAAVTVDPADASVRVKRSYTSPLPLFDRTRRAHVIQDLHCYLCDVNVGPKVKHCGVCNKCVEDFDHHCKWLNTCVGGRNYWYFFVALCSATLGVFVLMVVVLFVFIQHFLNPGCLRTDPRFDRMLGNDTWLVFLPLAPIKASSAGLLVTAFLTVALSATCLLLLCHLLGFHLYLFYKGMSTFDYVKRQRQKESRAQGPEVGNRADAGAGAGAQNKAPRNQESSIDCQPALSQSTSSCDFDDKGPVSSRLSGSICTELENFRKSAENENRFHYGTENSKENAAREISLSWKPSADPDPQGTAVRSVDSTPGVQDPLSSSAMTQGDT